MTAKSRLTVADISFLRNLRSFLTRQWPWLLLGLAALLFALRFIPALCLSLIDTETVQLPLFYHDVVTLHHSVSDWKWGGSSDFFPDVMLVFLLCFLSHNDWFALQGTMVCFFLGWLGACVGLVFALRRPHPLALVSILFLLMVGEACDFSFPRDRLAVAGRDAEGYLTYGPYVSLKPARYQVAHRYAYLAPPAPNKAAIYDLYVHTGNQMQSMDSAPLLCLDTKPHVFTEVFTVSRPRQTFEMRIYYSGSGTLRVDSLDITCEAP